MRPQLRARTLCFFALGIFASIGLSGCFPFAVATPPLRVSAGAGGMIGSTNPSTPSRPGQSAPLAALPFHFQMAVMPMQVMPKWYERRFDFGVGFQFYHDNRHLAPIYAPHIEGSYVLWSEPLDDRKGIRRYHPGRKGWAFGLTRVSITAQVQVPITDTQTRQVGFGTTVRLTGEFLSFLWAPARSGCSSGRGGAVCAVGTSWGETSIGLFFEGTYMTIMGRHFGVISAGFTFRIPTIAAAGIVAVWPG